MIWSTSKNSNANNRNWLPQQSNCWFRLKSTAQIIKAAKCHLNHHQFNTRKSVNTSQTSIFNFRFYIEFIQSFTIYAICSTVLQCVLSCYCHWNKIIKRVNIWFSSYDIKKLNQMLPIIFQLRFRYLSSCALSGLYLIRFVDI